MTESNHFNCPHCTYAFRANDPRYSVPKGQKFLIFNCPGCREPIRVKAPGAKSSYTGIIIIVLIIMAFLYFLK